MIIITIIANYFVSIWEWSIWIPAYERIISVKQEIAVQEKQNTKFCNAMLFREIGLRFFKTMRLHMLELNWNLSRDPKITIAQPEIANFPYNCIFEQVSKTIIQNVTAIDLMFHNKKYTGQQETKILLSIQFNLN